MAGGFDRREGVKALSFCDEHSIAGAVACALGRDLCHFDAEQLLVQLKSDYDVFFRLPCDCGELSGKAVKLERSLYGLRQASRTWDHHLMHGRECRGFGSCAADACGCYGNSCPCR